MTETIASLPNGIPTQGQYDALLRSNLFREMEGFSDCFLANNRDPLAPYIKRWIADPLHQWSRQWEYPFVANRIDNISRQHPLRVLDAGCGVTFFPFYLLQQDPMLTVDCCDYDESLSAIYHNLRSDHTDRLQFSVADLRKLPYPDASFDAVYCISVLEHTNAYDAIANEFFRVLRPGGTLIITFDISLDGKNDIPADQAEDLLTVLIEKSVADGGDYPTVHAELQNSSFVQTRPFVKRNPGLLPWKKPNWKQHVKSLLKTGRPKAWPADLTFYCLDVQKAS